MPSRGRALQPRRNRFAGEQRGLICAIGSGPKGCTKAQRDAPPRARNLPTIADSRAMGALAGVSSPRGVLRARKASRQRVRWTASNRYFSKGIPSLRTLPLISGGEDLREDPGDLAANQDPLTVSRSSQPN